MSIVDDVRASCAWVTQRARHVRVIAARIPGYAAELPLDEEPPQLDPDAHLLDASLKERAAYFLQLDAINFGSGWFPTLRKHGDRSGYFTIATGLKEHGPWPLQQLATVTAADVAGVLGQDPEHELMALFARSLNDLGPRVEATGGWLAVVGDSAVGLVERLAGWDCFADTSSYDGRPVPFLKRAQITAADLQLAGVAAYPDLGHLTLFADNLVPHVLRLDGVLQVDVGLVERIERGELIEHGSPEEVELRAAAVHATELIVAERGGDTTAATVDNLLWNRGQGRRYKAVPRPRSRCTAY